MSSQAQDSPKDNPQMSASDYALSTHSGEWRLFRAELAVNMAYAAALVPAEVLTETERDSVVAALKQIEKDFDAGLIKPSGKDVAALIEERLHAIVGSVAGKLNAGRSRNEQAMTALRLWLQDKMESIGESLASIQRELLQTAESHVGALMPGYTHFQPAQIVSCGHWLLSFFWMLARDQERLTGAIGRVSISPMGSGSLAGTPYRIERKALASALGFSDVSMNSMDAVSDLDFAAEFIFIAALIGTHLSRLAEDLILYSNPALGFVTIAEQYTTGSALMPHKRNPEAVELSRGKAGRLIGDLAGFLSALKGLPSTYNHDTQENREALFSAVDTLRDMLSIMEGVITSLTINNDRMLESLNEQFLISDLADYLVSRGVPYRDAYDIVQKLSVRADKANVPLSELPLADFQAESSAFDADVFAVFDYTRSVSQRATIGGTAPAAIRSQIVQAHNWLMDAGLA